MRSPLDMPLASASFMCVCEISLQNVPVSRKQIAAATRKRKYAQCSDQPFVSDVLVEAIESLKRTKYEGFPPDQHQNQHESQSADPDWDQSDQSEHVTAADVPAEMPSSSNESSSSDRATPQATVHNLVGTARIDMSDTELYLPNVTMFMPNGVFDRQKFAAITVRLHDPKCTVLLFSSGKMVLTGCKTFLQCLCASHEIVSMIRRAYPHTLMRLSNVSIQNIVGNADLNIGPDERIDLDGIMDDHNVYCTYLKHMFPGLIFRPPNSPVVLLLFLSGKVVITGGKSSHDVDYGWKRLWPMVRQYIRPKVSQR